MDKPLAEGGDVTHDDRIANNHIWNIGAEYRGGIGIVVGYAHHAMIEHNQIDHTPYAAISMGWGGWPDKVKQAGQANYSENNVVANNRVFNFMLVLADGGGIYTQGLTGPSLAMGEKVTGNVVSDQFGSGHAIYTDNGSCNITVSGNVIFNTNFDNWGSRHADYYNGKDGKTRDPLAILNNYRQQGDADSERTSNHRARQSGDRFSEPGSAVHFGSGGSGEGVAEPAGSLFRQTFRTGIAQPGGGLRRQWICAADVEPAGI